MEIHAYSDTYLYNAQNNLGHAADFAITSLDLEPDVFGNAFAVSSVSKLFEQRQRNINNAAAITLLRLSKALHCSIEELLEY